MSNHIEPNKLAAPKQDSKQASEKFEQLFASRIKKLKDRRATAYEFLWAIALVTAAVERQNKRSDRSPAVSGRSFSGIGCRLWIRGARQGIRGGRHSTQPARQRRNRSVNE